MVRWPLSGVYRPGVLSGQARAVGERLLLAVARTEATEDELDRDARALEHGFAHHDGGVGGDLSSEAVRHQSSPCLRRHRTLAMAEVKRPIATRRRFYLVIRR
jgi:hypothetical protein